MKLPEKYEVLVITLSDRAYKGEYEDLSGPRIEELTGEFFRSLNTLCNISRVLIPDDRELLIKEMKNSSGRYNIIFTTGGTGIGPRDITVETVKPLLTKEIPGVMEYIRVKYGSEKPNALLSRGVAGLIDSCLVYTLPGSVRAVNEYLTEIFRTLEHTLLMLYGIDSHKKS
jgi:molybdopterin adenylyltransferase